MKSELIVMLTKNDQTVIDAIEVFETCKNLPVKCWGFKDVGLPKEQMKILINNLKGAGKTTFLEVVSYTEEECMNGAKLAVEYGFDYLMGTLYYDSVWEYLKDKQINYLPFIGKVYGSPSVLEGSINEIITQAGDLMEKGIAGVDILAYRHIDDPEELIRRFCKELPEVTSIIAGSINSEERIRFMFEMGPWGFTIGSGLFAGEFIKGGSFKDNLDEVIKIINNIKII